MVTVEKRSYLEAQARTPELRSPEDVFRALEFQYGPYTLYNAGLPSYSRFFTRDVIVAGRAAQHPTMLAGAISLAGDLQAKDKDPFRGAYPGAIPHEYDFELRDGVTLKKRKGNTMFNASDTTAEWIIGHKDYTRITGDYSLVRKYREELRATSGYIQDHVDENGHFVEDPELVGAKEFALKVTIWRDSVIPKRRDGQPRYPVVYPFLQAQYIAAARTHAALTGNKDMDRLAQKMVDALPDMYSSRTHAFYIAADAKGPIEGVNSDNLHMLAYLSPGDLPPDIVESLVRSSQVLETEWGYRPLEPRLAKKTQDKYHADPVWPHQQAATHTGINRHLAWARVNNLGSLVEALEHAAEVALRPNRYYDENPGSYPETILDGKPHRNRIQLWSAAARVEYQLAA